MIELSGHLRFPGKPRERSPVQYTDHHFESEPASVVETFDFMDDAHPPLTKRAQNTIPALDDIACPDPGGSGRRVGHAHQGLCEVTRALRDLPTHLLIQDPHLFGPRVDLQTSPRGKKRAAPGNYPYPDQRDHAADLRRPTKSAIRGVRLERGPEVPVLRGVER